MTSKPQNSGQWNLEQFVKTLSYFGVIPLLSSIDWFQHWWGSRPDPTVDSQKLSAMLQGKQEAGTNSNQAQSVLVVGALGAVGQQSVQQLRQQGKQFQVMETPDQLEAQLGVNSGADTDINSKAVIYCADAPGWADGSLFHRFLQHLDGLGLVYQPIFDFAAAASLERVGDLKEIWGALDDVVMGGVSQSGIQFDQGVARFSGVVSTANSGGFASIRTRNFEPGLNLASYEGIELRVKGDGNRYKFMVRTETRWDGIAYCNSFDTVADQWITVRLPFASLIPVVRARTVSESRPNLAQVNALQLMLSKFEYDGALNPKFEPGLFQLQVQSIRAYRQSELPRLVLVQPLGLDAESLRSSGIPYTIVRPSHLTTAPSGQALRVDRLALSGEVGSQDVAALCLAALSHPEARNLSLSVTAAEPGGSTVGDWAALFRSVR